MSNLRLALRQLIKNPAFSAVAVITLALGIGANTAIFSIVNAVLLRPLPYPDADRIMVLNESSGPKQDFSVSLPDYFDWRNDNTVFENLACTHKESRNLSGIAGREPERVSCASVTRNFFNIIGLPPEIGRTFSEDEDKVGAPPVVVISDRVWKKHIRTRTEKFTRSSRRCSKISSANTKPISPCCLARWVWCCSSPARTSPICLLREAPRGRESSPFTPRSALPAPKLFGSF